ncbi:MAG: T9SS type A sorting domain-containing protein [candidate division Zixibacteria bacterium]|nr:T9SS type A sorting domain-containing protein [candidate division Zixibacteria bacterium]NIS46114.1 T9SS type A sorting domain-containing protein [candidate division Zixibacteria bacterium]NIV06287.1 T9SS type A sorting domain-containing protein [candidate division Zixibacteria bacterium]
MRVIDVSNPFSPFEIGYFDTWAFAHHVAVTGSLAYVADDEDGLYIIRNDLLTWVSPPTTNKPNQFILSQNYPNPFNPETIIRYQLPTNSKVQLTIYNLLGQKVRTLVNDKQQNGIYEVIWDGRNEFGQEVSSGIYIYRLKIDNQVASRKMVLLR